MGSIKPDHVSGPSSSLLFFTHICVSSQTLDSLLNQEVFQLLPRWQFAFPAALSHALIYIDD